MADYFCVDDVLQIPLNPRPTYARMIVAGNPVATGRILSVSGDKRTARVIWHSTPGTFHFDPDPLTIDVAYIVEGRIVISQPGKPPVVAIGGSLVEFPREPFDLQVEEAFTKVSFLYHPEGLKAEAEPL